MTVPAALLCLALTILCAALFLALRRVRRAIAALNVQIEQQRQQRAALDAIKDELIGNVSHELRTPLTSIRGALGLLSTGMTGALDAKGQHLLRIALTNTDRLIRLVTDILDLERMASGQAGLHFRRCSLTQLIQQAIETISPNADAAQVSFRFVVVAAAESTRAERGRPNADGLAPVPAGAPAFVTALSDTDRSEQRRPQEPADPSVPEPAFLDADPDRILQVLTNLLSNAIKFSPPASVVSLDLAATPNMLHLRIADQGRGIPEDKLESIFDRFQQVEITDARQKGGTGLGLAICRTIVQQHGGTIWAERNATVGASLCVNLPRLQRFTDLAKDSVRASDARGAPNESFAHSS